MYVEVSQNDEYLYSESIKSENFFHTRVYFTFYLN